MAENKIDIHELPNPEQLWADGDEYALVGWYVRVNAAYTRLTNTLIAAAIGYYDTNMDGSLAGWVLPANERHTTMERWLTNTRAFLPDWYITEVEGTE